MSAFLVEFDLQFIKKCMRYFLKLGLKLFVDQVKKDKLALEDIDFSGSDSDKKAYCVLVPWIQSNTISVPMDKVKQLQEKYPEKNIYVVNIFSQVRNLLKFVSLGQTVSITNVLCITSDDKLVETMNKNCSDMKTAKIMDSFQ